MRVRPRFVVAIAEEEAVAAISSIEAARAVGDAHSTTAIEETYSRGRVVRHLQDMAAIFRATAGIPTGEMTGDLLNGVKTSDDQIG